MTDVSRERLLAVIEDWKERREHEVEGKLHGWVASVDTLNGCIADLRALLEEAPRPEPRYIAVHPGYGGDIPVIFDSLKALRMAWPDYDAYEIGARVPEPRREPTRCDGSGWVRKPRNDAPGDSELCPGCPACEGVNLTPR